MRPFSSRLREMCLDMVWSLWAELGVSGWTRRHQRFAIDPEPLIIFTAWLGDSDPRLRDEAIDWCISYGRLVSASRLKNFLHGEPDDRRAAFGPFSATVAAHSTLGWPLASQARRYEPTRRSRLDSLDRPSLLALRLRSAFGVSARAEIIRVYLANPGAELSAAELVPDVGYTKRNIAEALDALRLAGLMDVMPWRNQLRYRLTRGDQVLAVAGPAPEVLPRWRFLFRVMMGVLDTAQVTERLPPRVRLVETDRLLDEIRKDVILAGLHQPDPGFPPERREEAFRSWAIGLFSDLASGSVGDLTKGFGWKGGLRRGRGRS